MGAPETGLKGNLLLVLIVAGALAGGLLGWFAPAAAEAAGFVGEIFLTLLKMLVVPLVVASMITGVASLGDVRRLGRTGGTALAYYAATTALALLAGILLVTLVRPGEGLDIAGATEIPEKVRGKELVGVTDMIFNPVIYVYELRLKTPDDKIVTPAYWLQLASEGIEKGISPLSWGEMGEK